MKKRAVQAKTSYTYDATTGNMTSSTVDTRNDRPPRQPGGSLY
jgi:hypothetical protein